MEMLIKNSLKFTAYHVQRPVLSLGVHEAAKPRLLLLPLDANAGTFLALLPVSAGGCLL